MKRTIKLGTLLILVIVLCSCGTFKLQTQPAPYFLPDNAILKLNTSHPVAIKNVSSSVSGTEDVLCGWRTIRVMGNLYYFTESTIGIVKDALQRKKIALDDKADKILALAVDKVTCDRTLTAGPLCQCK